MVRKARVSLCMIVRDEEQNLRECLAPVAQLFDEIVIVDTGSRDRTREIAREFTPHVFEFAWCDDFAAARNESLRHATGDWIFWLDADDRVRPDQVGLLRKLFDEELDDRPRAMLMDTTLVPAEPSDDVWVVTHPRLFRRHPELHWVGRVHEHLQPEPISLGYEWVLTDIQIEHVGYQDQVMFERKSRRKLRLLRMDYAVNPDNHCTLLHLGMALVQMRKMAEAREHFLRLVSMNREGWDFMRRVYNSLAEIALYEGKPAEAAHYAHTGLNYFPEDEHLLFALASALYAKQEYEQTVHVLKTIMQGAGKPHMYFGAVGNVRRKLAPRMLAAVQRLQRAFAESEATLTAMLAEFPGDMQSWYNLGLVYLDQGLGLKLAPVIQRLMTLPRGHIEAGLLAALWHVRFGDLSLAEPIIEELIATSPNLSRPRMLRAEYLSRMKAPIETQIRALRDVLRVHPGNLEAREWIVKGQKLQAASGEKHAAAWSGTVVATPAVGVV